jgi:galactoside O-acetyltransferase
MMSFYSLDELEELGLAKFGNDVYISRKVSLFNPSHISIGSHVRIDDFCVLSAGSGGIEIGNYVHIAVFSSLIGKGEIALGDFCNLSSRVSIYSSNDDYSGEWLTNPTVPVDFTNVMHADVTLGKHVIVGAGAVILPGVYIEEGTAIGALSLVDKSCQAFKVYCGVPIRYIGERKKRIQELEIALIKSISDIRIME